MFSFILSLWLDIKHIFQFFFNSLILFSFYLIFIITFFLFLFFFQLYLKLTSSQIFGKNIKFLIFAYRRKHFICWCRKWLIWSREIAIMFAGRKATSSAMCYDIKCNRHVWHLRWLPYPDTYTHACIRPHTLTTEMYSLMLSIESV